MRFSLNRLTENNPIATTNPPASSYPLAGITIHKMKKKNTHGGKREGAGRPPATEELKRVSIWISTTDMAEIEKLGFKKSPFVREAIKEKLAKVKEK